MQMHVVKYPQEHRLQIDLLTSNCSMDMSQLKQRIEMKDTELRQVQRGLAQWKDDTADKLASKFNEELSRRIKM